MAYFTTVASNAFKFSTLFVNPTPSENTTSLPRSLKAPQGASNRRILELSEGGGANQKKFQKHVLNTELWESNKIDFTETRYWVRGANYFKAGGTGIAPFL